MGMIRYVAIFTCLGLSQAIYFDATHFKEEYMCEIGNRTVGVCLDPGKCKAGSVAVSDCGIEGAWRVCCGSVSAKYLPERVGTKSRQKCLDFAKRILDPKCPNLRNFNGSNAAVPSEFPHMAALGYKVRFGSGGFRWLCSGSLISEKFVLTEHECATGSKGTGRPRRVRLGDIDLDSPVGDDLAQEIPIQKIHRLWKVKRDRSYHNVALLRLSKAVTLTPAVRPACLHTEPLVPTTSGVVAGWGKTTNGYPRSETKVLRKADLQFISGQFCEEVYDTDDFRGIINDGVLERNIFLCAGDLDGHKDTCMGDGGAPLMVKLASPYCTYSIVGILALGSVPCGQPFKPSMFTRVYNYLPWIEKIVWADDGK